MNLAVNAREAMPNGGTVTIETQSLNIESAQSTEPLTPGRYAKLSVRDDGPGMSEDTKAQIFEPFVTTKEPGRGPGLGLAMAYGIVKQLGGQIAVDSAPGCGTCLSMYFPTTDRSVAAPRAQNEPTAGPKGVTPAAP